MHLISNKTDLIHAYRKNMKYRKTCIAKSIAIFKNFLRKICHELGKHLPNSLSSIWQPCFPLWTASIAMTGRASGLQGAGKA